MKSCQHNSRLMQLKQKQLGAILIITLIMISVIAAIGISFGSIATVHKKVVNAQLRNLDSKVKARALRRIVYEKLKKNLTSPDNPCKSIPNCTFLGKVAGAALSDLKKGQYAGDWWQQNANQSLYAAADGEGENILRYIIREISTPVDGSHLYEIIAFAADKDGKYQNLSRQYKTLLDPNAKNPPPPPELDAGPTRPEWPADAYGTANEEYFTALIDNAVVADPYGYVSAIKGSGPDGFEWQVNGKIKLETNAINGKEALARTVGVNFNNNAGEASIVPVKDNFVTLIVAKVSQWPTPKANTNNQCCSGYNSCQANVTLAEYGSYAGIRAYNEVNQSCALIGGPSFALSGGYPAYTPTQHIAASLVFDSTNPVNFTKPFVAVLRKKNNTEFTVFTAYRLNDIKNHGTLPRISNDNYTSAGQFSIGPLLNFSEDNSSSGKVIIGELRYIDKSFTEQEITNLINSTLIKWGFSY